MKTPLSELIINDICNCEIANTDLQSYKDNLRKHLQEYFEDFEIKKTDISIMEEDSTVEMYCKDVIMYETLTKILQLGYPFDILGYAGICKVILRLGEAKLTKEAQE